MSKIKLVHKYEDIISMDNLLEAWKEFSNGKKNRKDVQEFQRYLMSNVILLHQELSSKNYRHSAYEMFNISDPKPRNIHKAKVRDRLLHRAIYRVLYPFFDRTFISDSFSCRIGKGTHKAVERFNFFSRNVSCNHTKTIWVLKCDIRKFFASINHGILMVILRQYIFDKNILELIQRLIGSFSSTMDGVGLPLGNLTSQLLVNIYMNEFDQYVKHKLKIKYYIRYADDFVILSQDKNYLFNLIKEIKMFLKDKLRLDLHPNKISIKTFYSGVDYLGWVNSNDHRVLRTSTKRKMFRIIMGKRENMNTVESYMGLLSHGNTKKLVNKIEEMIGGFGDCK